MESNLGCSIAVRIQVVEFVEDSSSSPSFSVVQQGGTYRLLSGYSFRCEEYQSSSHILMREVIESKQTDKERVKFQTAMVPLRK